MKELFSNIGSVITAIFSSTCCIGPAIFTGLGISAGTAGALGGLAGFIKALIPYRPIFIFFCNGLFSLWVLFCLWEKSENLQDRKHSSSKKKVLSTEDMVVDDKCNGFTFNSVTLLAVSLKEEAYIGN